MSLIGFLIFLGGAVFGAIAFASVCGVWGWIEDQEGANTPEGKQKAYWRELAKQYTTGIELKGLDAAHYHVMVSLLEEGKAQEYYWECWRNSLPVPPPPPFDMAFSPEAAPSRNTTANKETETNLDI